MKRQRGWTMVATLVVVVIMLLMAIVLFKGSGMLSSKGATTGRKDGHGTTVLGATEWAARDDVCRSNLSQIRSSLQITESTDGDGKFPATLEETHLGSDFYRCPIGHEPYAYDPATGEVHCVHPGHEKY